MWKCPPSAILVAVDFGDASSRALQVAGVLSDRLGARLRVLHNETIETPPYFTHEQLATIERERKAARDKAEQFVRDYATRLGVDPSEVTISEGSPTASIVEAARGADLVVMGTHGRRGPTRWWMGSVAERVVHESATPVLVVRADVGGVAPRRVFERPLVVSPLGRDDEAARVANGLAKAFGGSVSEKVVACQADLADEQHATLMVVSKAAASNGLIVDRPVEQWLRSCTLPMLFVPSLTMERV